VSTATRMQQHAQSGRSSCTRCCRSTPVRNAKC
jgi:hypothetical protein